MSSPPPPPRRVGNDPERARLASDYHQCVLSHYKYCIAGLALGVPVSYVKKSHVFWAIGGITGTMLDYTEALQACKVYADKLRHYEQDLPTYPQPTPVQVYEDVKEAFAERKGGN